MMLRMASIAGLATRKNLIYLGVVLIVLVGVLWVSGLFNPRDPVGSAISGTRELGGRAVQTFTGGGDFDVTQETPGYENYLALEQGCPVRDCIPSIDSPVFESASAADGWLNPSDVVFAIELEGETRAYPQRILDWHEIVNDEIGGRKVAITFCPLCGSALAFDREVNGQVLEFGVSGKLHNSDLVMYDRQTETLWQQISGEAIVGEQFGTVLVPLSMDTLRWSEWKAEHPETKVLSRETGFSRDYDRSPYGNYEQDVRVFFPVEGGVDTTLQPKTVVFGIEVNGVFKAYPEEVLRERGRVSDTVGGTRVTVSFTDGKVEVTNEETGEEIVPTRLFWFAWKAFRPETELFE